MPGTFNSSKVVKKAKSENTVSKMKNKRTIGDKWIAIMNADGSFRVTPNQEQFILH